MLSECIDEVAAVYAKGVYASEVMAARKEYVTIMGRLIDEDSAPELLESHLVDFLHWYVLDRPIGGSPPIVRFLREAVIADPMREILTSLAAAHRSLFEIRKINGTRVGLRDVLLGGAWDVDLDHTILGACVGDLCDARLAPLENGMRFVGAVTFFPRAARQTILGICEAARQAGQPRLEVLADLARRRVRSERYRHLPIERSYA